MEISINQMTTPGLNWRKFLKLASGLGAKGVEFRNDLAVPLFSESSSEIIHAEIQNSGLRVFGLSQIYPFNAFSEKIEKNVHEIIKIAKVCNAESISLIPLNDGTTRSYSEGRANLRLALREIQPLLENAGLIGMIEPLGFESSSLRTKEEAIDAIDGTNSGSTFKIVHDTFHHFLARENEFYPDNTGIIHVSGVTDYSLAINDIKDKHRVLVNEKDRLGNIEQINNLLKLGYRGPISIECFSPKVHAAANIQLLIKESINFIQSKCV